MTAVITLVAVVWAIWGFLAENDRALRVATILALLAIAAALRVTP